MAHNERDIPDPVRDESADTASFQRFVEQQDAAPSTRDARSFRLLSLLIGVIVLVALVVLLLQ